MKCINDGAGHMEEGQEALCSGLLPCAGVFGSHTDRL